MDVLLSLWDLYTSSVWRSNVIPYHPLHSEPKQLSDIRPEDWDPEL